MPKWFIKKAELPNYSHLSENRLEELLKSVKEVAVKNWNRQRDHPDSIDLRIHCSMPFPRHMQQLIAGICCSNCTSLSVLSALPSLSKLPVCADGIVSGKYVAVAGADLEGDRLSCQLGLARPHGPPVAEHGNPTGVLPLDVHGLDVTTSADVVDKDHHEVRVSAKLESYSTPPVATHPAIHGGSHHIH